jgi:membrane protein
VNVLGGLDRYQRRHRWLGLPLATVYKFVDDQGGYLAALITYYGFLSLFPLLLIMSTVLGYVLPDDPELQRQLIDSALGQFPIIGDQLASSAQPLRGSGTGLAIGILVALYGGLGVAVAVQNAFNQLWGVPVNRRPDPFTARLRSLLLLLLLGIGVLLITGLSTLATVLADLGPVLRIVAVVVSVIGNGALFVVAFRAFTARPISVREAVPGAVLAAVAWQALQSIGALYVNYTLRGSSQVYGLFGIVLGLLGWIYLEAVVIVLAAELNVVMARRLWPRSLLTPFVDHDDLTRADRRTYASFAQAQQYTESQRIDVGFEGRAERGPGEQAVDRRDEQEPGR